MFGKLSENVINIEQFFFFILIEIQCYMQFFVVCYDLKICVIDSLYCWNIYYYVLLYMQLYCRKIFKLSLGILVKKGNYEINFFFFRNKNNV